MRKTMIGLFVLLAGAAASAQLTAPQQAADCAALQQIAPGRSERAAYALLKASLCPAPAPPPVVTPPPPVVVPPPVVTPPPVVVPPPVIVPPAPPVTPPVSMPAGGLVQAANLIYQGAFRVPKASSSTGRGLESGGTALAFNPAKGSLLLVGHVWDQQVAEISAPAAVKGSSVDGLPTAALLQPLTDATEGKLSAIGTSGADTQIIGGLLPYNAKLYVSAYLFYDGGGVQTKSHFISGLDLSIKGDASGPFAVGPMIAGMMSGYFGVVPAGWQAALGGPVLNGNCCIPIISRTSYGPAVAAINPADIGTRAAGSVLLNYPAEHTTLGWQTKAGDISGTTQVTGVVFPEGTSSVLFFGRQGMGTPCYGEATACGNDKAETAKGAHAAPYRYTVWAYDAKELAAVKAGGKQPWEVKPYAQWSLTLPFVPGDDNQKILGAAYDPATGRIFVSQAHGDGPWPLIHVYQVQ